MNELLDFDTESDPKYMSIRKLFLFSDLKGPLRGLWV